MPCGTLAVSFVLVLNKLKIDCVLRSQTKRPPQNMESSGTTLTFVQADTMIKSGDREGLFMLLDCNLKTLLQTKVAWMEPVCHDSENRQSSYSLEVDIFGALVYIIEKCREAEEAFGGEWVAYKVALLKTVEGFVCKVGALDYGRGLPLGVLVEMKWLCNQEGTRSQALVRMLQNMASIPVYGRHFIASVLSVFHAVCMVCKWTPRADKMEDELQGVMNGLWWLTLCEAVDCGMFGNSPTKTRSTEHIACFLIAYGQSAPMSWNKKEGTEFSSVELWETLSRDSVFTKLQERCWYADRPESKAMCRLICVSMGKRFGWIETRLQTTGKIIGPFGGNVWAFIRSLYASVLGQGL